MLPRVPSPTALVSTKPDQGQSGPEFDSAFKQTVDDGHVKELAMYRDEVSRAANPQLRVLAEQRVATLQKSMAGAGPKAEKQ